MSDDKIDTEDLNLEVNIENCPICGKIMPKDAKICRECFSEYFPKIKKFVDEHPGIDYLSLAGRTNPPAPRNVIYHFVDKGFIKVK